MRKKTLSLTHESSDKLSKSDIKVAFENVKNRLSNSEQQENSKDLATYLEQLSEFELGRFLIKNSGAFSGYWTYYVILGFKNSEVTNPLENFILTKAPIFLATQQRFAIFQNLLRKHIQNNSTVCSIPSGLMADLLTLDLPKNITGVRYVGIDLDETSTNLAKELAEQYKLAHCCDFFQRDAWNMPDMKEKFNVLTSNGLNAYEKDDNKVIDLYKSLYQSLVSGGTFIGSALSCPPTMGEQSEWDMTKIDTKDMAMQKNVIC